MASTGNPEDADKLESLYNDFPQAMPAAEHGIPSSGPDATLGCGVDQDVDLVEAEFGEDCGYSEAAILSGYGQYEIARFSMDSLHFNALPNSDKVRCVEEATTRYDILVGGTMTTEGSCIDMRNEEALEFTQVYAYFTILAIVFGNFPTWIWSTAESISARALRNADNGAGTFSCGSAGVVIFFGFIPMGCRHTHFEGKESEEVTDSHAMIFPNGGLGIGVELVLAGSTEVTRKWHGCTERSAVYREWYYRKYGDLRYENATASRCASIRNGTNTFINWKAAVENGGSRDGLSDFVVFLALSVLALVG